MKITMILTTLVVTFCATFNAVAADDETLWIDVRSAAEYDAGHLPGAVNIDYSVIADGIGHYAASKEQPIKLYCGSGRRAGIAKQTLESLGYNNVSNEGGFESLRQQHQQPATAN